MWQQTQTTAEKDFLMWHFVNAVRSNLNITSVCVFAASFDFFSFYIRADVAGGILIV